MFKFNLFSSKSSSSVLPEEVLLANLEVARLKDISKQELELQKLEQKAKEEAEEIEKGIEEAVQRLISTREALKLAQLKTNKAARERVQAEGRAESARQKLAALLEGEEPAEPKQFEQPDEHACRVLFDNHPRVREWVDTTGPVPVAAPPKVLF